MKIIDIPFLDLLVILGIIALLIFALVIGLCMASSPEDQAKEDEEQAHYISEYFKRKGSKK